MIFIHTINMKNGVENVHSTWINPDYIVSMSELRGEPKRAIVTTPHLKPFLVDERTYNEILVKTSAR